MYKEIRFEDYRTLMDILEKEEQIAKNKNSRTMELELNKIQNLKGAITILAFTGMKISKVCSMQVKELKEMINTRKFEIIIINDEGIERLTKVFSFCLSEPNDNYIIRRYNNLREPLSRSYLLEITNALLKNLGQGYTTKSFRHNIETIYGITYSIRNITRQLGVTKVHARRLLQKEGRIFRLG